MNLYLLSRTQRFWIRSYTSTSRPKPLILPADNPTLLPLVKSASNLLISPGPYTDPRLTHRITTRNVDGDGLESEEEVVVPFFMSPPSSESRSRPIGFLRPSVLSALQAVSETSTDSPWRLHRSPDSDERTTTTPWAVSFSPWVNQGGFSLRSSHMNTLAFAWRSLGLFSSPLDGWSNEQYPVYHPDEKSRASSDSTVAFTIERAALPLFGFANYGCLLTAYFHSKKTDETMIWIPRRSRTKKTWPGRLDVTVGGGIGYGETPLSTIIRECTEEASFDPTFVAQNIRSAGVVSFPNRSPAGWILPGLYYLFDLPLNADDGAAVPRINLHDGEVESFEPLPVERVLTALLSGEFKPSSALALVDFLIRHGHVTEASDSRYADVCLMLRRNLVLPVPW